MQQDFQQKLDDFLRTASTAARLVFGLLTTEKMFVGYQIFSEKENWGNPDFFEALLQHIFEKISEGEKIEKQQLKEFKKIADGLTPDLDEHDELASFALDFCCCMDEILVCLLDFDVKHLATISELAFTTVDAFVQELDSMEPDDPERESKIANHEFMLREINRQNRLLELIKSSENEERWVDNLRRFNFSQPEIVKLDLI